MSFDAPLLRIRAAVRILKGEFQMKQYQKPEVFYENFTLAEHIALCDYQIQSSDPASCTVIADRYPLDNGDLTGLFLNSHACTMVLEDFSAYCYTNGAEGVARLFQS